MRISLNWLKDFIDIDKISKEICKCKDATCACVAEDIADKLTNVGFEVEEIIYLDKHLKRVVVGKIERIERHPDADKLFLCKVDLGDRKAQIITSATNVFEGALVPVALDGADLANGVKIKTSKIRGVLSEGMFCSGEELGIGEGLYEGASVNGILIFKDNFNLGEQVSKALHLNDIVLDISITANRPDAMSVIGIAREISAIYRIPIKEQDLSYETLKDEKIDKYITIENKDFVLCPRYIAAAVKNVRIKKSPLKIRARLFAAGIHAINNIVDITNYVLVEYGQPMHAFDRDNIGGKKIIVRKAKKGEKILAFNENDYELNDKNLVIADEKRPMVIAGVIGGIDSGIRETTSTIIFESACFERSQIRKTAREFGVRTDSSARFEKGVDIGSQDIGMRRALNLISQLGCGEIISGVIDCKEKSVQNTTVIVSKKRINSILGVEVDNKDIVEILSGLGIKTSIGGDEITLSVPSYRSDIENDADVAEEIIRMYGYDIYNEIEKPFLEGCKTMIGKHDPILKMQRDMRNVLVTKGFYEINSYSLVPTNSHVKLNIKNKEKEMIKVKNPLTEELGALRISMAHSLFSNILYNVNRSNKDFKIFETGRTYHAKGQPMLEQPIEKNMLAFASIAGDDFYTFKGLIEVLFEPYDIKYKLDYSKSEILHPGISADFIDEKGEVVASVGKINPEVAKNYEIPENLFYGEIECDKLVEFPLKKFEVKRVSKFPIVERDLAMLVDEKITVGELEEVIKQCCGKVFYHTSLFDIYRNKEQFGDKKSLAFRIKLLSDEKTLSEEEINTVMNRIIKKVEQLYGATIRK